MEFKKKVLIFLVLLMAAGMATGGAPAFSADKDGNKMEMERLLPLKAGKYHSEGKDQSYDRMTTFRYMDGAAELYRSYGFKLLVVRRYLGTDRPPIVVEVFDMGSSEDAFGVFSSGTEGEEAGIGQGSDYGGGLLRFWKGKFFVNVYAEQEGSSTREDVLKLGRAIAESIKKEGPKPKLIRYLPEEGLIERSIRYFHLSHSLNHHYFLSHENILNLDLKTNALLASYSSPAEGKTFLLLIQYPSQSLAREGLQRFVRAYMPESSASRRVKTENGRWTAAKVRQKYVTIVFDASTRERAEALIQVMQKSLEEKRP
jgi:hypothetical protein